jgi:hypothetical protein
MTRLEQPSFDSTEQAILDEVGRRLRADGWAAHVTVSRLLRNWQQLSISVDQYKLTIDDYTNDLTSRDGLELVLSQSPGALHTKLRQFVESADKEFLARTHEDKEKSLGRFYRIDEFSGWWWKRRPAAGPLAEYLAES